MRKNIGIAILVCLFGAPFVFLVVKGGLRLAMLTYAALAVLAGLCFLATRLLDAEGENKTVCPHCGGKIVK